MKVRDCMTTQVHTCGLDASLAAAATQMWAADCGILPIVENDGRLAGVLTDRDICLASAAKHRLPDDIKAREMVGPATYFCSGEDDALAALHQMAEHKVRRLPVIDAAGRVAGMLSMNDVLLAAVPDWEAQAGAPTYTETMEALKRISLHRCVPLREEHQLVATR